MPSVTYKQALHSISVSESPLEVIEFSHEILTPLEMFRFVNDNVDVLVDGKIYIASRFYFQMAANGTDSNPTAELRFSCNNADINNYIKSTFGAKDGYIAYGHAMRSDPDYLQKYVKFQISNCNISTNEVTFSLNFKNIFRRKAITETYRPQNAEGVFSS